MKASKRLRQSLAALTTPRISVAIGGVHVGKCHCTAANIQQLPKPVVYNCHALAEKLLAKLNKECPWDPKLLRSGPRPPGCKRRGGKWVPR